MTHTKMTRTKKHNASMSGSGFRPGLRFNILVYLGFLMLIAVVLASYVLFKITADNFAQNEVRRARDSMQSLNLSLGFAFDKPRGMDDHYRKFLHAMVTDLSRELELENLLITGPDGKIIAAYPRADLNLKILPSDLKIAMNTKAEVLTLDRAGEDIFSSGIKELSIAQPITRGRRLVGGIKATFSIKQLDDNIRITQQLLGAFVVASTILIMVFGVYYLSRTIIWPLRKIVNVTGRFADGDLGARVELKDKNELGYLAESFNEMAEHIEENQRRLENNVRELEQLNRDLKRTQAELIYSEKRSSIGQLAEGVAHEIGNPLGAVLGYLEIMKKHPLDERDMDLIDRSEKEISRINDIILELLHYSRPAEAELGPVDLNEVVSALVTLISGQKRFSGVNISRAVETGLPTVKADRNRLLQVLVNLTFNAADSIEEGGELEIGAAKTTYRGPEGDNYSEAGDLESPISDGDDVVELWVKDKGVGISADNLKRIFDPFFTTKDPGEGTGLGLAVSAQILEQLGARLRIESAVGKGTTATVTFTDKS